MKIFLVTCSFLCSISLYSQDNRDLIDLTPITLSKEVISLNIRWNSDLSASGKVRNEIIDYQDYKIREKYQNYNNELIVEHLEKGKGSVEISN